MTTVELDEDLYATIEQLALDTLDGPQLSFTLS
jgi:hypothetical protein